MGQLSCGCAHPRPRSNTLYTPNSKTSTKLVAYCQEHLVLFNSLQTTPFW
eukprot:m.173907 g.173907  ORF g.173907 m.173907 type:complete len:50 (-) comp17880_c1_seq2:6170-6319(-)